MRRNQGFYRSAELYDPATGEFQPTGATTLARAGHAAVLLHSGKVLIAQTSTLPIDGRVLIDGGRGDPVTASAELYDPRTSFTITGSIITACHEHAAGLLPDGRGLIAGGSDERDSRMAPWLAPRYPIRALENSHRRLF